MSKKIVVFVLPFFSVFAFGFERFPEFRTLTENEQSVIENGLDLGSEYYSDVLAFQKPFEWERLWMSHQSALDVSVGSISPVHFLIDKRAKLRARLLDPLEFRFTYFAQRDFEQDETHALFELIHWWKRFGLSLYMEPSFYKREDDLGAAVLFMPTEQHEIRVFYTWVDFTRIRRNNRTDTFDRSAAPFARGVVGRAWSESQFMEYSLRHETPTVWIFPDSGTVYRYWKWIVSALGSRTLSDQDSLEMLAQYERKFESDSLTSSSATRDRRELQIRWVSDRLVGSTGFRVKAGFLAAENLYKTLSGRTLVADWLPHFWFEKAGSWQFGLEWTRHIVKGARDVLRPANQSEWEGRLNIAYEFLFAKESALRVVSSVDLDRFGTGETWEGGNLQFRLAL